MSKINYAILELNVQNQKISATYVHSTMSDHIHRQTITYIQCFKKNLDVKIAPEHAIFRRILAERTVCNYRLTVGENFDMG